MRRDEDPLADQRNDRNGLISGIGSRRMKGDLYGLKNFVIL